MDHFFVFVYADGYVFDVDEYLVDGDVVFAAETQFHLHGFDQHGVHGLVGFVELFLFVVDAVEEVLQVGYFGDGGAEVVAEAVVEALAAFLCH